MSAPSALCVPPLRGDPAPGLGLTVDRLEPDLSPLGPPAVTARCLRMRARKMDLTHKISPFPPL